MNNKEKLKYFPEEIYSYIHVDSEDDDEEVGGPMVYTEFSDLETEIPYPGVGELIAVYKLSHYEIIKKNSNFTRKKIAKNKI